MRGLLYRLAVRLQESGERKRIVPLIRLALTLKALALSRRAG